MDHTIGIVFTVLVVVIVGIRVWKTCRDGLVLALLRLGVVILSAAAAYGLALTFLNPGKVDAFGLGEELVARLPAAFLEVDPGFTAFFRAVPTALISLVAFAVLFEILRSLGEKLVTKLNEKYRWSERHMKAKGFSVLALFVSAVTSILCLMVDLVLLCGIMDFGGDVLLCAEAVTGEAVFGEVVQTVQTLEENPLIRAANDLGCRKVYRNLTTAKRGTEEFAVGDELGEMTHVLLDVMPVVTMLTREPFDPDPAVLRQLGQELGKSPKTVTVITGLLRSSVSSNGGVVELLAALMDTDRETMCDYLAGLETRFAPEDLQTVCNIMALLAERGHLTMKDGRLEVTGYQDPQIQALIREELQRNPRLLEALGK